MIECITFEDRDEFERKPFAEKVIRLIEENVDVFPLAINGEWGTGKTEFCKKTVHLINQEYASSMRAEYFDAFSEDSYNQPLTSILASLYKTYANEHDKQELKRRAANLMISMAGGIVESLVSTLDGFSKVLPGMASKILSDIHEQAFERKSKTEEYLDELKSFLIKVTTNEKLVLFIDELDRCRPDYALHLLEVVKHVFDMPNLKIIFVVNSNQLVEIVRHNYGNNQEVATKYLDKFFRFSINLPQSTTDSSRKSVLNARQYVDIEFERLKISDTPLFKRQNGNTVNPIFLLYELVDFYKLSLRDVEKLARNIVVFSALNNYSNDLLPGFKLISLYAIFQYTFNGKMYQNHKYFNDAFKQNYDLLPEILDDYDESHYRHILYLILFEADGEIIDCFFDHWTSRYNLDWRRKYFIDELIKLDNLVSK